MIHRNLQNLISLFHEGKFVGFTTTFSLVRLVHLVALISPVSPFYLLLLSWSHCSGFVCLSYLVRSNWLLWIGSFYCRDLDSLIPLEFVALFFRSKCNLHLSPLGQIQKPLTNVFI